MANLLNYHNVYFTPFSIKEAQVCNSAGVYMFCRKDYLGVRQILYIGETGSFCTRLGSKYDHWSDALMLGMNEILLHFEQSESQRLTKETYLRNCIITPLNRQGHAGLFGRAGY